MLPYCPGINLLQSEEGAFCSEEVMHDMKVYFNFKGLCFQYIDTYYPELGGKPENEGVEEKVFTVELNSNVSNQDELLANQTVPI